MQTRPQVKNKNPLKRFAPVKTMKAPDTNLIKTWNLPWCNPCARKMQNPLDKVMYPYPNTEPANIKPPLSFKTKQNSIKFTACRTENDTSLFPRKVALTKFSFFIVFFLSRVGVGYGCVQRTRWTVVNWSSWTHRKSFVVRAQDGSASIAVQRRIKVDKCIFQARIFDRK